MSGKKFPGPLFLRVLEKSVFEILGKPESEAIFQCSGIMSESTGDMLENPDFSFILEKLAESFAERYDAETAKGLLIRTGRSSLNHLRRYEEQISSMGGIENRLKPVEHRFSYSLDKFASFFCDPRDIEIDVQKTEPLCFQWRVRTDPHSDQEIRYTPYFFFGLLQEFCEWLDARKNYQLVYTNETGEPAWHIILIEIHDPD